MALMIPPLRACTEHIVHRQCNLNNLMCGVGEHRGIVKAVCSPFVN
jgi:hypothetical protein